MTPPIVCWEIAWGEGFHYTFNFSGQTNVSGLLCTSFSLLIHLDIAQAKTTLWRVSNHFSVTLVSQPSPAKIYKCQKSCQAFYLIECLSQFCIRVLYSIICYLSRDFLIFCKIKYKPIGEELYGSWLSTPRNQHISCFLHQSKPRIASCHNQQQYLMRLSYLGTHLKMG